MKKTGVRLAPLSHRRLIGLTGGIATGKSTVSAYLEKVYKLPVLDADQYAREAVQPGTIVLNRVVERYGTQILQADGQLDRPQLGHLIFRDEKERHWLETQIHPVVQSCFQRDLAQLPERISPVILSIPLLFEARLTHWVTEIWVVTCTPSQQNDRLRQRNGLSEREAHDRIQAQMPLNKKCELADQVLDNSGSLENLYRQVDRALRGFLITLNTGNTGLSTENEKF